MKLLRMLQPASESQHKHCSTQLSHYNSHVVAFHGLMFWHYSSSIRMHTVIYLFLTLLLYNNILPVENVRCVH